VTYAGSSLRAWIDASIADKVRETAAAAGATPYVIYLAAFLILLHRYTGQDDLVIGSPNANRSHVETDGLMG
jgi:non-ribosomal peptide synthetase component F